MPYGDQSYVTDGNAVRVRVRGKADEYLCKCTRLSLSAEVGSRGAGEGGGPAAAAFAAAGIAAGLGGGSARQTACETVGKELTILLTTLCQNQVWSFKRAGKPGESLSAHSSLIQRPCEGAP